MRIVKRHAGGPENQVINFFRPYQISYPGRRRTGNPGFHLS